MEPITGEFNGQQWLENGFLAIMYGVTGLGAILLPFALLHRTFSDARAVLRVVGGCWLVTGAIWAAFGTLNYFTHIGLTINTYNASTSKGGHPAASGARQQPDLQSATPQHLTEGRRADPPLPSSQPVTSAFALAISGGHDSIARSPITARRVDWRPTADKVAFRGVFFRRYRLSPQAKAEPGGATWLMSRSQSTSIARPVRSSYAGQRTMVGPQLIASGSGRRTCRVSRP